MSISVLVVDDDPTLRSMLELALAYEGFVVSTAEDVNAAFAAIDEDRPDVVLMDVMLRGADGREAVRYLRGLEDTHHLPVILLTGLNGESDVWRGWQAGIDSYLTKPVDTDCLVAEIYRLAEPAEVTT